MSFISDLLIEISSFRIRVGNKLNTLSNRIGDLTALTTTNKNSLVGAINEVNGKTSALDDFGGRNFLVNSFNFTSLSPWSSYVQTTLSLEDKYLKVVGGSSSSPRFRNHIVSSMMIYEKERVYFTLSVVYKNSSGQVIGISGKSSDSTTVVNEAGAQGIGSINKVSTTELDDGWIKDVFEIYAYAETPTIKAGWFLVGIPQNSTFYFRSFKLEKGRVATDWTPAPEDQVSNWSETDNTKYSYIKNKPTLVNNYLDTILTTNSTTAGTVYTFKRVGLSDLNITLTPASASFSGVVTTGAQTFAGNKTVTGLWTYSGTNATPITIERTNTTNTNIRYINQGSSIYAGATNGFGGGVSNVFAIGELADLNAVASRWVWFDSTGRVYSKNDGDSGKWDQAYQGFLTLGSYVLQSSLNAQLNNYATKAGTQTFTGTNTFTQAIYIPAATLAGHAVNLGQMQAYVTGLGYTTMTSVQTWVNSQNYATSASIGNGTVVLQGLGYLAGTATFSMNQSNNVVGGFDLTQTAKNYIGLGTEAYSKLAGYFGGVERYFHNHDVQSEGSYVDASQNIHTFVTTTNMGTNSVDISTHVLDGAELVVQGNSGGMTTFYLPWMDPDGNTYDQIDMEMGAQRFFWIEKEGVWKIV